MAEDFETFDDIATAVAPAVAELPEIKLFGRWSCDDVQVSDMSLQVSLLQLYHFANWNINIAYVMIILTF